MDTAVYSAVQPSNAEGALMLRVLMAVGGQHGAEDANTLNSEVVTRQVHMAMNFILYTAYLC